MCYSPLTLSKLQVFAFMCAVLTSKVHLLMIVWCLMFSAWRESTMLKLAQVKIVSSVVIDDVAAYLGYTVRMRRLFRG